ncbi:MAG TPA: Rieske (2Fe-2S) protein [Steroidobacteraceae bacterium]|nr:Rieske (2Fe-2S) protein [Steroidobacteraceae bacterium]
MTASSGLRILSLADLPNPGSREFKIERAQWPLYGFVVRKGDVIAAYLNRCPHAGHPLNLRPDKFFTPDEALLMCNSHGALFEPESGRCVAGPCTGKALVRIPIRVEGDEVLLDVSEEELQRL